MKSMIARLACVLTLAEIGVTSMQRLQSKIDSSIKLIEQHTNPNP